MELPRLARNDRKKRQGTFVEKSCLSPFSDFSMLYEIAKLRSQ
jgi:hypothetical protein